MEKFFKLSVLERLYETLTTDFEQSILNDNIEGKEYYTLQIKKDKLYNILKDIIGNNKEKLNNLFDIIRQLEQCYCEETDFWNKKYFKLGFVYTFELRAQIEDSKNILIQEDKTNTEFENENLSLQIHNFLDNIRQNKINKKQKIVLNNFIKNLEKCTDIQKRRFLMYYNLLPNNNQILTYTDIGKIENCSGSAIKISVISVISQLIHLDKNKMEILLNIIQSINNQKNL